VRISEAVCCRSEDIYKRGVSEVENFRSEKDSEIQKRFYSTRFYASQHVFPTF
jgi:hypothetical protein